MDGRYQVTNEIVISAALSDEALRALADEGFQAVVNLREAGESDQPLSPDAEGDVVRSAGVEYFHHPISVARFTPEQVDEFRNRLRDLPRPVLIHCSTGARSGAFALMDLALAEGWSGALTLDKAEQMGIKLEADLAERVKAYIDSRQTTATFHEYP